MRPSADYRREIDGLRACAVVPVVLFHLGSSWLPGGFLGVDVFFVISGFLITRILLRDIEGDSFSFAEFMTRRILRIVPALLAMIVATLVVTRLFIFRPDQPNIGRQALAALVSLANVYFWRTSGNYWAPTAEQSPLVHTWSLSVEEQFYLVAPLCFWMLHRVAPRSLRPAILAATMLSLGLFLYGLATHRLSATFYLLPTRAWELGAGCCLAAFPPQDDHQESAGSWWCDAVGLLGLVLIFATYVLAPGVGSRLNWIASLAVAGTAMVLAFARTGPCHWLLTRQPLIWLGKASYSIYLWHWPVIVFAEPLARGAQPWLLFLVAVLLGAVSYALVEQSFRGRQRLLPVVAAGYAIAIGLAFLVANSTGLYDTSAFDKPVLTMSFYGMRGPECARNLQCQEDWNAISAGYEVLDRVRPAEEYLQGGLILGGIGTPRVVVLGDSHGCMWAPAIRAVTERRGITTSFQAAGGDPPFIDMPEPRRRPSGSLSGREKIEFDKARQAWIARWKPDLVIIGALWSGYQESDAHALLAFLETHAGHVILIEQPPELDLPYGHSAMQWLCYQGVQPREGVRQYLSAGNVDAYERGRHALRSLAQRYRNVTVMPTRDLYDDAVHGGRSLVLDGKQMVFLDANHVTDHGAMLARPRFDAMVSEHVPRGIE